MEWQEVHRRLLTGLYSEVRSRWGRISEIEERLGLSGGYLNKLCKGKHEFKLTAFLKTLSMVGLDPKTFFSRTLEIHTEPGDYLRQLEGPGDDDRLLAKVVQATRELEGSEPSPARSTATAGASDIAEFTSCPRAEQRRRLHKTARYRTHAFAHAYLEHLDALRYDDAREAATLAAEVAVGLIPNLPGPQSGRLSLQCLALGVFGSARRQRVELHVAARALQLALDLARRERLLEDRANLMIRASYLLKDFGHFSRALALLNEAMVAFVQLGSRRGTGRALVDHGMMNCYAGNYDDAVLDLRQGLAHLEDTADVLPRYQLAAYQFLAYAHEHLGDLERAEKWLAIGASSLGSEHAVDQAKLEWLRGSLAFKRGDYALAAELLAAVAEILSAKENPVQEALVSLDLVSVLLAQNRHQEATELATSMARLLFAFKNNGFAEAAIAELVRAVMAGKLSQKLVVEARAKVEACASPRR